MFIRLLVIADVQAVQPAAAYVNELSKPNTASLGAQSRSAAAELEAIISSRNGNSRALPALIASPALLVCLSATNTSAAVVDPQFDFTAQHGGMRRGKMPPFV
jgi:hypothetical protein